MYKIAKTDLKYDFIFIVDDSEFYADIILFACFSNLFQTDISLIEKEKYTVESDVSKESFQDFLDGCQGKAFSITSSNVYDLNLLCKEFQINQFEDKVEEFYEKHKDEALINKLKYFSLDKTSSKNSKTIEIITGEISRRLTNMDSNLRDQLFSTRLTYEIINQFLSIKDRNYIFDRSLYQNIIKFDYDNKDKLFQHIDLRSLSVDDVKSFCESRNLPQFYESNRVFPFLSLLIDTLKDQKRQIDKLQERVETSVNGLNNEIDNIEKATKLMQNEISAVFDDLGAIQQDCHSYKLETDNIQNEFSKLFKNIEDFDKEKYFPLELRFKKLEEQVKRTLIYKNPLDGIFHRLYCQKDMNPAESKSIEIKTPTPLNPDFKPSNLLEYGPGKIDDCYYHNIPDKKNSSNETSNKNENSEKNKNNWIEFDFGEKFGVKVIAYTIRTNTFGETFSHPKDFKLEGKNEGDDWVTLDERNNAIELNGSRKIHTYFLKQVSIPFRKIRFVQLDTHFKYKDKDQIMALSAFELHGDREYIMPPINADDNNNNNAE